MKTEHKYRICPACDFFCNVKEKHKFCPKCGISLIEKCSNCGEDITNPYDKFCGVCGKPLREIQNNNFLREIK